MVSDPVCRLAVAGEKKRNGDGRAADSLSEAALRLRVRARHLPPAHWEAVLVPAGAVNRADSAGRAADSLSEAVDFPAAGVSRAAAHVRADCREAPAGAVNRVDSAGRAVDSPAAASDR